MRLSKSQKLQFVLLILYLFILLIPVASTLSFYNESLQYSIEQEMNTQVQVLNSGMRTVESSLQYADAYVSSLHANAAIRTYLSTTALSRGQLVSSIMKVHEAFPMLKDPNDIFHRLLIYSEASGWIIDGNSAYLNPRQYYYALFPSQAMDYDEWRDTILHKNNYKIFFPSIDNEGHQDLLYIKHLAPSSFSQGKVILYMDMEKLIEWIAAENSEAVPRSLFLFDVNGSVLYQSDSQRPANELFADYGAFHGIQEMTFPNSKRTLIFSCTLEKYGWTLYTAIPHSYFARSAKETSIRTLRNIFPFQLISLMLGFFFIHYSHRPIRKAISAVSNSVDVATMNPFKYVEHSVNFLSDINQKQAKLLCSSSMEIQEAMLTMLVYQKKQPSFPLEDKLKEYGLVFEACYFSALILQVMDHEKQEALQITNRMHMIICEMAVQYVPDIRYLKMNTPDQMIFLSLMDDQEEHTQRLRSSLNRLCWEISRTLTFDVRIYIGEEVSELSEVYISFRSARELLISRKPADYYLIYSSKSKSLPVYDYLSEDARRLRKMSSMGNLEAVRQQLEELFIRNSSGRVLNRFERQLMYSHMLSTLLEAGYDEPLHSELTHDLADVPIQRFFELLEQHYATLCLSNQHIEKEEEQQLIQQILSEIDSKFGDYSLTQAAVAIKFSLSERRLTALVRQQTGLSFSEYLEKIRIENASVLLCSTNLTIE
ncbi:MAG TPA: hypothetical protein PLA31_08310, partial [Clostridia bacterium]|nr:hypothetical protein [Clostridia bacterium]